MSQTQTQPKPAAADVQPAVFVRMAAVVRMTGLGRSTIYRLMADRQVPVAGATGQARRGVAPHRPRAVERRPAHGVALTAPRRDGTARKRSGLRRHRQLHHGADQQHRASTLPQRQVVNQ
jgi:hypothetical protein